MVVDKILPNLEAKWPGWVPKKVRTQKDGVMPHPKAGKDARLEAKLAKMKTHSWDITLYT